ncbi:hypothetical protein ACOMHN_051872 [Nucella lapillus]
MTIPGKQGPQPAYHRLPATPTCPPYPVHQGPTLAPRGYPLPTLPPPSLYGHQLSSRQPYITGCSVPQAYAAYGRPPHGLPPYGQAPVDFCNHPHGVPPYTATFPVGYGYPPMGYPPHGKQVYYPPTAMVPELPTYRPPPGGTLMIEGQFDAGAHFLHGGKPTVGPPPEGWQPSLMVRRRFIQ